MRNYILLIAATYFITCGNCISQKDFRKGYLITLDLDTIVGYINYGNPINNSTVCIFKTDIETNTVKYYPCDILSYRFISDKYYVSRTIGKDNESECVFLEYIIKGKLNIYYRVNKSGKMQYFAESENGELTLLENTSEIIKNKYNDEFILENKEYVGTLSYLMKDRMDMVNEINNSHLSHKSLINVAKSYHNKICIDKECIVFEKKNIDTKITAGIVLEYINFSLNSNHFIEDFNTKYDVCRNAAFGFLFNLSNPAIINSKISFQTEVIYNKSHVMAKDNGIDFKYSSFKIPLILKYSFLNKPVTPYLGFGFVNYIRFNQNINRDEYWYMENKVFFLHQYSFMGVTGFDIRFKEHFCYFLNARYEIGPGYFSYISSDKTTFRNLAFQTGMMFKLN